MININFININSPLSSVIFINELHFLSFSILFLLQSNYLFLSLRYKSYNIFDPTFVL